MRFISCRLSVQYSELSHPVPPLQKSKVCAGAPYFWLTPSTTSRKFDRSSAPESLVSMVFPIATTFANPSTGETSSKYSSKNEFGFGAVVTVTTLSSIFSMEAAPTRAVICCLVRPSEKPKGWGEAGAIRRAAAGAIRAQVRLTLGLTYSPRPTYAGSASIGSAIWQEPAPPVQSHNGSVLPVRDRWRALPAIRADKELDAWFGLCASTEAT